MEAGGSYPQVTAGLEKGKTRTEQCIVKWTDCSDEEQKVR